MKKNDKTPTGLRCHIVVPVKAGDRPGRGSLTELLPHIKRLLAHLQLRSSAHTRWGLSKLHRLPLNVHGFPVAGDVFADVVSIEGRVDELILVESLKDIVPSAAHFARIKTRVVTVKEDIDTSTPDGRALAEEKVAALERRRLRLRRDVAVGRGRGSRARRRAA